MSLKKRLLFKRKNYLMLVFSILIITFGYFLMSGGGSQDPLIFNKEIYSFQRIRIAPALVIIGFTLALFSIIYNNKAG
mgnify:FL=1